jgi:Sulfotransferase domain
MMGSEQLDFDVMIVGAQKSGTSTLLRHLLCAPGVAPMRRSEVPYFTDDDEFSRGTRAAIDKYFGTGDLSGLLRVGKDVVLLTRPQALPRLLTDSPHVQLVVSLRNPVDRAYSAYWFAKRRGFEPARSFSEAIHRELEGRQLRLPRPDLREYVRGGEYHSHLERLFEEIDSARVRIILFEEMHTNTRQIANDILGQFDRSIPASVSPPARANASARARSERLARFAGSPRLRSTVRRFLSPQVRGPIERAIRRLNDVPFKPPPMSDDVRAQLVAYYAPHNDRLANLIGRDLRGWNGKTK